MRRRFLGNTPGGTHGHPGPHVLKTKQTLRFSIRNDGVNLNKYLHQDNGTRDRAEAPEPGEADERERALVYFQPIAKRALRIADEHDLRIYVHKRVSRSGAKLIDRIDAKPII